MLSDDCMAIVHEQDTRGQYYRQWCLTQIVLESERESTNRSGGLRLREMFLPVSARTGAGSMSSSDYQ